ncbi:DSD1 family PLP-dependent enzyme [Alteromonas pelagimontana]|uniref:DSD1 family PLP-dependent enzyme n=1 Tax=Alteromonas pelagimontana TaxID=1858656 RepID=A0A6M4MGU1_9ALTE|nr:alanine racemase [Alteromonas pelagimontana]QJR82177.1 DSD1 family PLP-dependent enzyme [Alteromonas pelagimontana]
MTLLASLITPACIIDESKLRANAKRMQEKCARENLILRPHVKTLKSLQAAEIYAPAPSPITVSTLAEARYFASAGYSDILYAVGISPNKVKAINELLSADVGLTVIVDSMAGAKALTEVAPQLDGSLRVAVEVDVDNQRAGINPNASTLVEIARLLSDTRKLQFKGLMAHAGASYQCFSQEAKDKMAQQECEQINVAVASLAKAGISCEMVSVGSTPTALADISHEGITELRAGVYATFDCVMAGINLCEYTDIALSVLTSVIGHQQEKGWVLIDAGWMALSRDKGTTGQKKDCGYGLVCDIHGNLLPGWYVSQTNQEHGVIAHVDGRSPMEDVFSYGSMLRILPIHACATASQFAQYHVTRDNHSVSAQWSRIHGW